MHIRLPPLPRFTGLRTFFLPQKSRPEPLVVLSFFGIYCVFLIIIGTAAAWPNQAFWSIIVALGVVLTLGILLAYLWSLWSNRNLLDYKPNLGNSVILFLASILIFTIVYVTEWYPLLRADVLVPSTDSVTQVRFPSIAVLQRKDWTSQGKLVGTGSKCYLGWYNETAPACSSLDPKLLGNTTTCTCTELWYNNDEVVEDFEWMGTNYRYKVFNSPTWLQCNTPTYLMALQIFFDYNASKARADSGITNPTLFIAVYDPELGMQKAFEAGYTRMNLINANGIVAINVGLRRRKANNGIKAYDYTLSLSPSPSQDLVCDTSSVARYQYPCRLSLFVQIPNFDRSIITTEKAMKWGDVVAAAGAYFSFAQVVAWIVSGLAFTPG